MSCICFVLCSFYAFRNSNSRFYIFCECKSLLLMKNERGCNVKYVYVQQCKEIQTEVDYLKSKLNDLEVKLPLLNCTKNHHVVMKIHTLLYEEKVSSLLLIFYKRNDKHSVKYICYIAVCLFDKDITFVSVKIDVIFRCLRSKFEFCKQNNKKNIWLDTSILSICYNLLYFLHKTTIK